MICFETRSFKESTSPSRPPSCSPIFISSSAMVYRFLLRNTRFKQSYTEAPALYTFHSNARPKNHHMDCSYRDKTKLASAHSKHSIRIHQGKSLSSKFEFFEHTVSSMKKLPKLHHFLIERWGPKCEGKRHRKWDSIWFPKTSCTWSESMHHFQPYPRCQEAGWFFLVLFACIICIADFIYGCDEKMVLEIHESMRVSKLALDKSFMAHLGAKCKEKFPHCPCEDKKAWKHRIVGSWNQLMIPCQPAKILCWRWIAC